MYVRFFKRLLDIVLSSVLLLLLSPVLIVVSLLLLLAQGSILFSQSRPGKNEKIFKITKFKSMTDERGPDNELLPDEERLTRIGQFVRKTSLDEIPQLFNVLKGEMSLIGPRPLLVSYLPLYNERQKKRHLVRPGITGWAQVNGRNAISWDQKFEYDVWYVENISFSLDMKILWLTFLKVLKREGISSGTSATMEFFTGNEAS
ncbi:sugar transferase [Poritiphilus flavus]|uniref:Lipid carrier--UDP-N-acetylgalactosaminyltransferase n=1 Tax=Poritiphilus flavus TaxID=2697053 RepID=A0A6L9EDA7_9FLAO|nr:sugar transferase [Poritiphilus flavus]NAS12359.1 lipid carrier--UDP-N-acetylgalactosaminyltransferase [Poritiphilus flavus]